MQSDVGLTFDASATSEACPPNDEGVFLGMEWYGLEWYWNGMEVGGVLGKILPDPYHPPRIQVGLR